MQTEATIVEVTQKEITKKDNTTMTLFEVTTDDGITWTTGKNDLALDAHTRVGQRAVIDGTVKENQRNGKTYKNYYLNAITDSPTQLTAPTTTTIPTTFPTSNTGTSTNVTWNIPTDGAGTARDMSIWRQTATKVAAHISDGDPQTFWTNVDELIKFYQTGVKPAFVTAGNVDDDIPFS